MATKAGIESGGGDAEDVTIRERYGRQGGWAADLWI